MTTKFGDLYFPHYSRFFLPLLFSLPVPHDPCSVYIFLLSFFLSYNPPLAILEIWAGRDLVLMILVFWLWLGVERGIYVAFFMFYVSVLCCPAG
jgi:hypothetical protein